jgi:hypothetical protein
MTIHVMLFFLFTHFCCCAVVLVCTAINCEHELAGLKQHLETQLTTTRHTHLSTARDLEKRYLSTQHSLLEVRGLVEAMLKREQETGGAVTEDRVQEIVRAAVSGVVERLQMGKKEEMAAVRVRCVWGLCVV